MTPYATITIFFPPEDACAYHDIVCLHVLLNHLFVKYLLLTGLERHDYQSLALACQRHLALYVRIKLAEDQVICNSLFFYA